MMIKIKLRKRNWNVKQEGNCGWDEGWIWVENKNEFSNEKFVIFNALKIMKITKKIIGFFIKNFI